MKQYNFDEIIERKGTNCVKFDNLKERFGNEHLTPLWVADMDFRTPDFIVNAIRKRCEHEIFGYTFDSDSYLTVSSNGYIISITGKSNVNDLLYPRHCKGNRFRFAMLHPAGRQSDYPATGLPSFPHRPRKYEP